jgi:hypothetical protein
MNTSFPPDPFSFFIDSFDGWMGQIVGFRLKDLKETVALVQGHRRANRLIGRQSVCCSSIVYIRTDAFVRIEPIEARFTVEKDHVGWDNGRSVPVNLMHGRVPPVNDREFCER